jgi:hypothetical protein
MSQRISLDEFDFKKLVRHEIVEQGALSCALLGSIDHEQMFNAVVDAKRSPSRDEHWLKLDEGERQMAVLAFAELALSRPGWDHMLKDIAQRIDNPGAPMYESMKKTSADRVAFERWPLVPIRTLHHDDEEVRRWIHGINQGEPEPPGDFLFDFAKTVCRADHESYPLLRPAILALKTIFPKYRFTGAL